MSPELQRIKIAEACGWKNVGTGGLWGVPPKSKYYLLEPIPDYTGDLNVIQKAVETLPDWQQVSFAASLSFEAGHQGKFTHQLKAADWAKCFLAVLQAEQVNPEEEI